MKKVRITLKVLCLGLLLQQPLFGADLSETFQNPPSASRPWCYWYWTYNNISREGIIADIEGLASAGIGGVYLMNIGGDASMPWGDVVYGSEEWWDLFKLAVSEAAKHNIKFAFHSPGYSGAGGPWITPEYAMQRLTWSETVVEGGKTVEVKVPRPETLLDYYRDIAVLAFPQTSGDEPFPEPVLQSPAGKVLKLASVKSEGKQSFELDLTYSREVTARSLFIKGHGFAGTVSYWDEQAKVFRPITQFRSIHTDLPWHVGSAAFNPVKARQFRLVFSEVDSISELCLGGGKRIDRWVDKAGYFRREPPEPLIPADAEASREGAIPVNAIVDLSMNMDASGKLSWTPPAGRWTILRFGHTPTGSKVSPGPVGGKGLECDKMSRVAADYHYDHCVRTMMERIGPELVKKAFVNYHEDSYEAGIQTWTPEFVRRFAELRGYDMRSYLPCLTGRVVGDVKRTEQFMWDYRRTIGDLFTQEHFGQLAKRCAQDGILFSNEPYTGPWSQLQVANVADIPMIEFWSHYSPNQKGLGITTKAGILAGRANERPIIAAESFTSGRSDRWSNHPFKLKALGDWAYCSGVNRFVLHVSSHQPWMEQNLKPGFSCGGCGTQFHRNNTWWKQGAPEYIGGYLTRCQSILQQGVPQAETIYFQGDDSPCLYGPFKPALPQEGYDFDACTVEPLMRMKVEKGMLVLPKGKTYRYLVLPANKRMTLASLKVILGLASQGAQVVGNVPEYSPSLGDADKIAEFNALREDLRKRVRPEMTFDEILKRDNVLPYFEYEQTAAILHAAYRRIENKEVFFVAMTSNEAATVVCRFRVTGRKPELWHPDTGKIEACPLYQEKQGMTEIPLAFDPSGSVFVVFPPESPGLHVTQILTEDCKPASPRILKQGADGIKAESSLGGSYRLTWSDGSRQSIAIPQAKAPIEIKGPWKLTFPKDLGAPDQVQLERLISWTEHPDAGVKYFSGTAVYHGQFTANEELPQANLDLGRVEVIAKVTLNGHPLEVLWKPPFVYDVSGMLKKGVNQLQVEVVNLWPNRMIGDEQYPDDCTPDKSWTSGGLRAWPAWVKNKQARPDPRRISFVPVKMCKKDDPLLPSGLLGPVMLVPCSEIEVVSPK